MCVLSAGDQQYPSGGRRMFEMTWRRCIVINVIVLTCILCIVSGYHILHGDKEDNSPDAKSGKASDSDEPFCLAKHFQDNMVLQRAPTKARIYGFSDNIGSKVSAQLFVKDSTSHNYSTTVVQGPAPGVGSWAVTLDPMDTTDPVVIKVTSSNTTLTLKNVLFGDVWLCSGQSNMVFTVSQMFNGDQEAYDADKYPNIRLMSISRRQSATPLYDLDAIDLNWTRASKASVSNGAWNYFSAVCWLFGKHLFQSLNYPIGLVSSDWNGTPVQAWSSPDVISQCPEKVESKIRKYGNPQNPSCLWNSMIYPLLGTSIRGAIWYQGEQDSNQPNKRNNYNCTFPAMIDDWRSKFNQASQGQTSSLFPFGFVQLGPYRDNGKTYGFPDIRWHQTADVGYVPNARMPNTFMAVAMDLPDFKSDQMEAIHPRNKEDIGHRLALAGLSVAYNRTEFMSQGPFPVDCQLSPPDLLILDYGRRWFLHLKGDTGFELSCSLSPESQPLVWHPAVILAHNATSLTVSSHVCNGTTLHGIRYAWRESPCGFKDCAVYSVVNDLPAPPFIAYFIHGDDGNVSLGFSQ